MECPVCGGHVNSLLKCQDCGEDCLPQELRGARPADATHISEEAVRAGLGPYAVAARESGLGLLGDGLSGHRTPIKLWLLRAAFVSAGLVAIWIAWLG